ncbi:hypothetical protein FPOA_07585 [Fusarium poae]|uniref:Uncharacterized protein n=1 Tax=Fusarium poae TaxID=36050 RepID=A0A1B8AL98_FUSPO|nr:hypothetical protein FPOA_07585 [Fusarium poae]
MPCGVTHRIVVNPPNNTTSIIGTPDPAQPSPGQAKARAITVTDLQHRPAGTGSPSIPGPSTSKPALTQTHLYFALPGFNE